MQSGDELRGPAEGPRRDPGPGGELSETPRRARLLRRVTLALVGLGVVYAAIYASLGATVLSWLLVAGVLLGLGNLGLLRLTRRPGVSIHLGLVILAAVLVAISALTGGPWGSVFSWLFLLPVIAAFLAGLRTAWIWLGVVWLTACLLWWWEPGGSVNLVPEGARIGHALQNRLAVSLALALMTTVFLRSFRRMQDRLKGELARSSSAATELRLAEARYRDLVENSPALICTHDRRGRILSANRALVRFLGYERADPLIGCVGARFLAPEVRRSLTEYLERVFLEGSASGVIEVMTRSGERGLLQYDNRVRWRQGEEPEVQVVARDVTEQERARGALLRQVEQEELVSSIATRFISVRDDDLRPAVESALAEFAAFAGVECGVLVLVDEASGRVNGCFESCVGGEPSRRALGADGLRGLPVLGERLLGLETVLIDDIEAVDEAEQEDLRSLVGWGARSAVLVPLVGRTGLLGVLGFASVRDVRGWAYDNLVLIHLAGYVFASAVLRAGTEQKARELEAEVQHAHRMESLGVVAGGIAHDFNNYLMAVLGNAGLAQSQLPEGSSGWVALEQVLESARRAARLSGQMLSFSGSATLVLEKTDLNELVAGLVGGEDGTLLGVGGLQMDLAPSVSPVDIDGGQIRRVVRSLIVNAAEAMEGQPGVIRVRSGVCRLSAEPRPGVFRPLRRPLAPGLYSFLEVVDEGSGIDPESLPRVFEPFFTTRHQRRGLELAAALGVMRAHRGGIEVESRVGVGTTMRILLPASEPAVRGSLQGASERLSPSPAKGSVLVVDDESSVLAILRRMLEVSGYGVLEAASVRQALDLLSNDGEDLELVLLDFSVGAESPKETLERIGASLPSAPIIVMSGYSRGELEGRLGGCPLDGFLEKPFDVGALVSEIERVLGH